MSYTYLDSKGINVLPENITITEQKKHNQPKTTPKFTTIQNIHFYTFREMNIFIKDWYKEGKDKGFKYFSHRAIAHKLKSNSTSIFAKICNGKKRLNSHEFNIFSRLMSLDVFENAYFKASLYLSQLKNLENEPNLLDEYYNLKFKLLCRSIGKDNDFVYASKFYYPIVAHSLLQEKFIFLINDPQNFHKLRKHIVHKISIHQLKDAVYVLEKLGFITRSNTGPSERYIVTNAFLKSSFSIKHEKDTNMDRIKKRIKATIKMELMRLSMDVYDDLEPHDRVYKTKMFTIAKNQEPKITKIIEEFERKLNEEIERGVQYDRTFLLHLIYHPLSKPIL